MLRGPALYRTHGVGARRWREAGRRQGASEGGGRGPPPAPNVILSPGLPVRLVLSLAGSDQVDRLSARAPRRPRHAPVRDWGRGVQGGRGTILVSHSASCNAVAAAVAAGVGAPVAPSAL